MENLILYMLSGAVVGFLVGMTGVGGGSLMTPLLLLFGFPPSIAIGTDLLYATVTKSAGALAHRFQNTIDKKIVLLLCCGCIPSSLITVAVLNYLKSEGIEYSSLLIFTLGYMLLATAAIVIFRQTVGRKKSHLSPPRISQYIEKHQSSLTIIMGVILGALVTLSSVGAGVIGTAILMLIYPKMSSAKIVGTSIMYTVPMTAIAGLGHMHLGHVDYTLLAALLVGSVPAIAVGSKVAQKLPEHILQTALASCLFVLGLKYAFF